MFPLPPGENELLAAFMSFVVIWIFPWLTWFI